MSGHGGGGHESHGGGGSSSEYYIPTVEKLVQVAPQAIVAAGGFAFLLDVIFGMVRMFGGQV